MQDTSAVGVRVRLVASVTYPLGIWLDAFPEDNDLGSNNDVEIGNDATGINGDLIWWKTGNAIDFQLPLIPNNEQEALVGRLYLANKVTKNRRVAKDIITIQVINPVSAVTTTFKNGYIRNGNPSYSYGGDGRIKSKNYQFRFESMI